VECADEGRGLVISIVEQFQQIALMGIGERCQAKIIEHCR
jgi:hypothetical protein